MSKTVGVKRLNRRFVFSKFRLPTVMVSTLLRPGSLHSMDTANISTSGIGFYSKNETDLQEGHQILVDLRSLEMGLKPAQARIVRIIPTEQGHYYGAQFVSITSKCKKQIEAYMGIRLIDGLIAVPRDNRAVWPIPYRLIKNPKRPLKVIKALWREFKWYLKQKFGEPDIGLEFDQKRPFKETLKATGKFIDFHQI